MSVIFKSKTKKALLAKTKAEKKRLEQEVSIAAVAASAPEDLLARMKLERRAIGSLKSLKKRVRKSHAEQIQRVASSLRRMKQAAPVLIDESGEIIDGHIVVEALKKLGSSEVWCVAIDHLDQDERALLHVALNRIGECGDWDFELLGPLLVELDDIGIELTDTGFSLPELDIIMSLASDKGSGPGENDEIEPPILPISLFGDIWILGDHKLMCGDATKRDSYLTVLAGEAADAVFTDCPWNIPIDGFVSGLGKVKHKNFKSGAGEMSPAQFATFCEKFHRWCSDNLNEGGAFFSCIDWRSVDIIMAAGRLAGLRHVNTAVWNKGSGGMGVPYRSAHEFVVVFCKGDKFAVNNIELGKHGRDRTNVWTYPGANKSGSSAGKALAHHPTPKPVEMVRDALLDLTNRGACVLDPFLGSGTTLLAAEHCGRRAYGIELDPAYVDVAIRRWEAMTSKCAVHEETGLSFVEIAEQRAADSGEMAAA